MQVSIVIPCKNRGDLLAMTLHSLISQTFTDWEAVIVDDGSLDDAHQIAIRFAQQEWRIRSLAREGEPVGANRCRNIGARASQGEFVIFLDSDDCLSPNCLERRVAQMRRLRELDFAVFPHQHFVNEPGDRDDVWRTSDSEDHIDRYLRVHVPWQTAGPIWRRTSLVRLGPWDESLACSQDWDFHLRALTEGLKFQVFQEPFFYHRATTGSRESISSRSRGAVFMASRQRAVEKALLALREKNLLNQRRRRLLARLYCVLAEQWMQIGEPERAYGLWEAAREQQLVNGLSYAEGAFLLRIHKNSIARRLFRGYLKVRWPSEMQHTLAAE